MQLPAMQLSVNSRILNLKMEPGGGVAPSFIPEVIVAYLNIYVTG